MKLKLKKIREQVIVITGASSGIGLTTARMAARQGAKLVLASRSDDSLKKLEEEIRKRGGDAIHVDADVGSEEDVQRIADAAIERFGGFDTWVNNAGVSMYGKCLDVSINDMKRLMDTNLWGVIYGSRIACEHLRTRGGALINVGSEVSDKAVPLQGIYSTSKHAVKGWTDALRMELEQDELPISVTLIKPAAIDTPYPQHAKNYMEDEPQHAAPVYSPDSVAEAILYAAGTPVRDLFVGGGGKAVSAMAHWAPRLTDKLMGKMVTESTHSGKPAKSGDALHTAGGGLRERGDYPGLVRDSMYTKASIHPMLTSMAALGAGIAIISLMRKSDVQ